MQKSGKNLDFSEDKAREEGRTISMYSRYVEDYYLSIIYRASSAITQGGASYYYECGIFNADLKNRGILFMDQCRPSLADVFDTFETNQDIENWMKAQHEGE